jgi:hypothetical protein
MIFSMQVPKDITFFSDSYQIGDCHGNQKKTRLRPDHPPQAPLVKPQHVATAGY